MAGLDFNALLERLRRSQTLIDASLELHLPSPAQAPTGVHDAMRYAGLSKGKRLRAIFLLWACEAVKGDPDLAMPWARAIECVHASSLILDDLPCMDGAQIRRGQPTLHTQVGEAQAILASVALLNHAYEEVASAEGIKEKVRVEALKRLVESIGPQGLIGGQSVDLLETSSSPDLDQLEYIHSHKTGALFIAAGELGALAGGARASELKALHEYAKNLGLAFQITDDLLDYTGTPETTGKDAGLDRDKTTFVDLCGIDGSRKLVDDLMDTACAALKPLGRRGRDLVMLAEWIRERDR